MSQISSKEAMVALAQNGKEQAFFLGRWFREAGKGVAKAVKEAAEQAGKIEDAGHMLPEHKE
jgi:hypothetical protein